ncbi:MAG: glycosyltransferase [Roseovarius sp.]|uniref:glycosyltransferase family 2 protein n=1 Tax=Roseovarius sp. TaxID=1486281 RepID=UPI0032EC9178
MRSDWTGKEAFSQSGSALQLTEDLSLEWRDTAGAPPARADFIFYQGRPVIRIATSPGQGWIRLHLKVKPENKPALGARFVMLPLHAEKRAIVKPFVAVTNLRTRHRTDLAAAPGARMPLERGYWYDIAGAFLCKRMDRKHRMDILVDVPRDAQFLLAECAYDWFDGDLDAGTRQSVKREEALPLSSFAPRPVGDLGAHLASPPVYAISVRADRQQLAGGALTRADSLYWSVHDTGLSGAIRREGDAQFGGFQASDAGIGAVFGRELGDSQLLKVSQAEGEGHPLWMAEPGAAEITKTPVSEHLRIRTCKIKGHELLVEGEAVHPVYPGMPVRVELRIGVTAIASALANPPSSGSLPGAGSSCQFAFRLPLRPHQRDRLVVVAFEDFRTLTAVASWPLDRPVDTRGFELETAPPAMPADATVAGEVETFGPQDVTGWAVCEEQPDAPVELVLKLGETPFAYTRTRFYRKEAQTRYGGWGFCGFKFELPPNMAPLEEVRLSVVPIGAAGGLVNGSILLPAPEGRVDRATMDAPRRVEPRGAAEPGTTISVVVLNRDGADLLDAMFRSCAEGDLSDRTEWIIVDHGSVDGSEDVCREHAKGGATIRFLPRGRNDSFSASNNFGARQASGSILVFANNDLVFTEGFGDRVRSHLSAASSGVVGARLLDHVGADAGLRIDQHLGVFLDRRTTEEGLIRPYEARNGSETDAQAPATRCIAVTGAFLAMRRANFLRVGGFDEAYVYGLEDVDLCLRVRRDLGLNVICANDIVIAHHRGYSRQKTALTGVRIGRNAEVFTSRWGASIRRLARATRLTDPALVAGARPVVAFLSDADDGAVMARELGAALQRQVACHVRHIPESGWTDLAGVDIAIVLTERFDLRKVGNAGPWLTLVRWMWAPGEDAADVDAFDHVFVTSTAGAAQLERTVGRRVQVLPAAASQRALTTAAARNEWVCDYCLTGVSFR